MISRPEKVRAYLKAAGYEQRRLLSHRPGQRLAPDPSPTHQRQGEGEKVPGEGTLCLQTSDSE